MKKLAWLLIAFFAFVFGCRYDKTPERSLKPINSSRVKYAGGFEMTESDSVITLVIKNPWQHANNIQFTYRLSGTLKKSYAINDYSWAIKTPVKKVICLSTTHIGFIEGLGKTASICGISGHNYVVNDSVRKAFAEQTVFDVGYDENLNYEMILKLKPDVVFTYGVNVSVTNTVKKLKELGIPVVMIGEYLEEDPLGKMEWIKVFAALYGNMDEASKQFKTTSDHYEKLKKLASTGNVNPTVLLGLPWNGSWYVSGSRSYIARLINDAGGNYIWNHLDFNESRPFGLEAIYENALTADYWINPGEARSKKDITAVDPRFKDLPSIKNDKVYNNDLLMSATGGNAFYESGVIEPDVILSDLIFILHPQLLPSHQLKYYRKIQ